MNRSRAIPSPRPLPAVLLLFLARFAIAQVPTEVQLPGTQPGEVPNLAPPTSCATCHGGYDPAVEPFHNWGGSMMSHAARDPVFWATLGVAEQDFPGSGDLCIRCHTPNGWAGGRSVPTNGTSLVSNTDGYGVTCATCHKLTNPDQSEHLGVQNPPFIANDGGLPAKGFYGSGMYVLWGSPDILGPYANPPSFHQSLGSKFHRQSELCGTCHDVSNPVTGDLSPNNGAAIPLAPGSFSGVPGAPVTQKAAFNNLPHQYGVVERTYSEHKASAFANMPVSAFSTLPGDLQRGALQTAWLAATAATPTGDYEDGTVRTFSCQTCHMPPVEGYGDGIGAGPLRKDLPKHDLTGGNYWSPQAIQYLDGLGKLRLGGGMSPELVAASADGIDRARATLERAAALDVIGNTLRVVNLTGHKLISGYPEGRRMWLRLRWRDASGALVREDGAYGPLPVMVNGNPVVVETILDLHDPNTRFYETHPGITQDWAALMLGQGTPANTPLEFDRVTGQVTLTLGGLAAMPPGTTAETFHFVLNNTVLADTRIPPYGFDRDEAAARNALPVPASQYGNPAPGQDYRYYDELALVPPPGAVTADIDLLYQPTSWEYIQFLLLANQGNDPFLGTAGQDLYDAWIHTGMATPHVMASATWTDPNHPWIDLGHGLAGSFGIPHLWGAGSLQAGAPMSLTLTQAPPYGIAHLIVGFSQLNLPFYGGLLVPNPDVVIPNLPLDGSGSLALGTVWPAGIPAGLPLAFQYLIPDGAAPIGLAQSNAVQGTTH